jgi:hypothetical protein
LGKKEMRILKQLKSSFFQWLSTGLFVLLLTSCGSFTHTSYRVESVLAITEKGDTIAVPLREFERQKYDTYTRFNYNNNWYWNNWRYDFNWRWQQPFFAYPNQFWWYNDLRYTNPSRGYRAPNRPKVKPKTRPRVATPRGSRPNYTPRQPQRIQRNTTPTRTRTTPRVQTRTNVGRSSSGGRRKQ